MDYDYHTEQDETAAFINTHDDSNNGTRGESNDNDLGDHIGLEAQTFGSQTRGFSPGFPASPYCNIPTRTVGVNMSNEDCVQCETSGVPFCHVKLDAIVKLQDSTKKLLYLLEELQSKTHSKALITDDPKNLTNILKPLIFDEKNNPEPVSMTDILGAVAIRKLENHTKELDAIVIEDEDTDCSVYKRLTRKCHCLNQKEYNDFIIHFNEETKFCTSTIGEMIKNMRILKKFLYIGGKYTKHALMFLNEGLTEATHTEKVEIIQAISFADLCNVFDEHTIVTVCIWWPTKNDNFAEPMTQELAAGLLYKLAQMEEGRRYLNFNSKIMCDIKKVIKKKSSKIDYDILECLNSVMTLCQPAPDQQVNCTYYCRPAEEDLGNKTLNALMTYRHSMSFNEVFQYMDMLHSLSRHDKGKHELTPYLPAMLSLFKNMLLEYDNSGMNILITNILNNIVAKNTSKERDTGHKTYAVADTATEPVAMKNAVIQIPVKRNPKNNNINQSKLGFGISPHRNRLPSKRKVNTEWDDKVERPKYAVNINAINRPRKCAKDQTPSIIVVPLDEKNNRTE